MILRISMAAVGLLALGGSITAVNAADSAVVPAEETATLAPAADLPRFEPSAEALSAEQLAEQEIALLFEPMEGGVASWYGEELAGNRTASGERFDPSDLTAAHRTLPLGSKVRVTYAGRTVVVRINDRGPFHGNRVIDLSRAAAEEIGLRRAGSGRVQLARLAS